MGLKVLVEDRPAVSPYRVTCVEMADQKGCLAPRAGDWGLTAAVKRCVDQ